MKALLAIHSCHAQRGMSDMIRRTWLQNAAGIDTKFFIGSPALPAIADEIFLPVDDTFAGLWEKTRGCIEWAYALGYDYIFKCDNDTYVHVPRLLASGFEQYDYIGYAPFDRPAWGGPGYWLSRRAMALIIANRESGACRSSEDWWVFCILKGSGVLAYDDRRYADGAYGPAPDNDLITTHVHGGEGGRSLRDTPAIFAAIHERARRI